MLERISDEEISDRADLAPETLVGEATIAFAEGSVTWPSARVVAYRLRNDNEFVTLASDLSGIKSYDELLQSGLEEAGLVLKDSVKDGETITGTLYRQQ